MPKVKLKFNWKLFNPNFHHLEKELTNIYRRFIWCYGGSSSAKSYSVAQAILIIGCLIENSDTLVFRKVSATIDETIYKDFKNIIYDLKLDRFFNCQAKKIKCVNGSQIVFKGLDDPEKIKGISSFKRVVLEEVSEFDYADFKQIRKRLRGIEGQQIVCMFNPINKEHWIKKKVFDMEEQNQLSKSLVDHNGVLRLNVEEKYTHVSEKWEGGKIKVNGEEYPPNFVVIKSTYLNNFWVVGSPCKSFGFIDIQTIADFDHDKKTDYNFYSIYALGNWGKLNKGGEFYKKFKAEKHVTDRIPYESNKPLHISFDENLHPYLSLSIYQASGLRSWKIDEICLEHPNNSLAHVLKEFKRKYPPNREKVFLYGDRTSLKGDSKLKQGENFFTLIEDSLKSDGYTITRRLPSKNPSVSSRGNFINEIFEENIFGIEYLISDNCTKTIEDYESVKEAPDGTKLKQRTKDPVTKITYEKYGHLTDTDDYFICEYYKLEYNKYLGKRKKHIVSKPINSH
ncbi:hypothetical protein BTO06_09840 [Tenacibaculum sp. SZ-18]|uniref:PBSX family phage terminase large subunit n=1 Tax=Tenacibaculum sp. SZ-18 TaxID=754423 RepID=UPI000C2D4309|nr:PBSX family phage terminase large subunit [Tenacibaculum sp. SZ-18]AUC15421.1 hypothetical protein BTO06_09840 [Tenacibaculum sp. SZ-18]